MVVGWVGWLVDGLVGWLWLMVVDGLVVIGVGWLVG